VYKRFSTASHQNAPGKATGKPLPGALVALIADRQVHLGAHQKQPSIVTGDLVGFS
jgi:hypothetical protein